MFKRLSVTAAVFFLLTAFAIPALAGMPYDATSAISDALQNSGYYQNQNPNGDPIHYVTDTGLSKLTDANGNSYGFLVYGDPHGDQKGTQSRYIGFTLYGEDYTNMSFPADQNANGADFASQNWISQPWDDPAVKASNQNITKFNPAGLPGDGDPKYRTQIMAGIMAYGATNASNGYTMDSTNNPSFWANIDQYVHILTPPTQYAWGIGRMWHYDANGTLFYVTVPIAPIALLPEPGNLKADSIDLGVPAGQKAEPGAEYTATVVFENETNQAFAAVPVAILHGEYQATLYDENGQVLPKQTVNGKEVQVADFDKKGASGAKRTFTCKWHPAAQAKDGLTGIINRDEIGKVYQETTYDDNIVSAQVDINAVNLIAVAIDTGAPGEAEPDTAYTASVTFRNDSNQALTGVPVGGFNREYRAVLKDANGNDVQYADFAPGEVKGYYFTYHTPDAGVTRISGVIDTDPLENKYQESTEEDNKVFADVVVREVDNSLQGDRRLNLQAYLKAGEDIYGNWQSSIARDPYTAKWTDDVDATLTVEKPVPPRGTLDWWEITWAKITYPEQNPDFMFGNPVHPVSTVTKWMDTPGRADPDTRSLRATASFEENWALDGFPVYNMMTGETMSEYPKNYPVSVSFKVSYHYYYIVCGKDGCERIDVDASYTDTAAHDLLVNGSGTVPYGS